MPRSIVSWCSVIASCSLLAALAIACLPLSAFARRGGAAVTGSGDEARCKAILDSLLAPGSLPAHAFAEPLFVGPGLWQRLRTAPELARIGKDVPAHVRQGDDDGYYLEGAILAGDLPAFQRSRALRAEFEGVSADSARPATEAERDLYYSLIAWEIEGKPVTVIGHAGDQLMLQRDADGRISWLDRPSSYPLPFAARDLSEVLGLMGSDRRTAIRGPSGQPAGPSQDPAAAQLLAQGIVRRGDLMWTVRDNGADVTWSDAQAFCKACRAGNFTDWRLPTIEELQGLAVTGDAHIVAPLALSACCAWSGTRNGTSAAMKLNFNYGSRYAGDLADAANMRVLCVRRARE